MIIEMTDKALPDGVTEKPTGRLRWRVTHMGQAVWNGQFFEAPNAATVLQQEFERIRYAGKQEQHDGYFWRDVPTGTGNEEPSA